MYPDAVPVIVVVGNYGVGKSLFVNALRSESNNNNINNNNSNKNTKETDISSTSSSNSINKEYQLQDSELIVPPYSIHIDDETVTIVDTAARDVMATQHQMSSADLVIVIMNASKEKSIDDLDDYWIEQFNDLSLEKPIIACFNQIDRLSALKLNALKKQFSTPTKEHFVLETILYVSAYTGDGIAFMKQQMIDILRNIRECPRWVIINPYTWQLRECFECALHRIFRLLDKDSDTVLNFQELAIFHSDIFNEPFTPDEYNFLLKRLSEQNDGYVTLQGVGLTFLGFRHLMKRFAIAKKWDRCWEVLHYFHYQNNILLHPRVFPQLMFDEEKQQSYELHPCVYQLLLQLFFLFADERIIDDDNHSIASTMISQMNINQNQYNDFNSDGTQEDMQDTGQVLSIDGIKECLSVLPSRHPELHCTLLDKNVMDHFETTGRRLNKLTQNGWLTFWAMFAVESPDNCAKQLTYLDLSSNTNRSTWFVLSLNNDDKQGQRGQQIADHRSVIRVLLFGGPECGKTVLCDRLLCRVPRNSNRFVHRTTSHFRAVSNRIGASSEYLFLAITEVPAISEFIEKAMDDFLPAFDIILLMYDVSQSRSFYELHKIFDRMPKTHSLPIQVLSSKCDRPQVQQYNEDLNDEKYDIIPVLNSWGLSEPERVWLTANDTRDFPEFFDDIYFIASNPHFRRLKIEPKQDALGWGKIAKRTITITIGITVVMYSVYRIYRWWNKDGSDNGLYATPQLRFKTLRPRAAYR